MDKTVIKKTEIMGLTDLAITFSIPAYMKRYFMRDYEKDTPLTVTIVPYEKKRSLNQNAKLWALIGDIDHKMNGRRSKDGENSIYTNLIQAANIQTLMMGVDLDALPELQARGTFRVIEVWDVEGKTAICRCYYGSSQFNTKEMADFIAAALDYAEQVGIDTAEYDDLRIPQDEPKQNSKQKGD